MKFGVIYPQIELGGDPRAFDAVLRASEALGYDFFAMFDHDLTTRPPGPDSRYRSFTTGEACLLLRTVVKRSSRTLSRFQNFLCDVLAIVDAR